MKKAYIRPLLYVYPRDYAQDHNELEDYRTSHRENLRCKEAIEKAIANHYSNNSLNGSQAVGNVVSQFGYERTMFVLACTVKMKDWDGRFSASNKQWAKTVVVYEDKTYPGEPDTRLRYVVNAHPGLVDLFITAIRKFYSIQKEDT